MKDLKLQAPLLSFDMIGFSHTGGTDAYLWSYLRRHRLHPLRWSRRGTIARFIRHSEMAATADQLIAFWDGKCRGTAHMIKTTQRLRKPTHIIGY